MRDKKNNGLHYNSLKRFSDVFNKNIDKTKLSLKSNKREKYVEEIMKKMIIEYKKTGDEKIKEKIVRMCFPIIYTVLGKFGKKVNTVGKIFDNEDLFNEGIIILLKCVEHYKKIYKVKFITFLWVSLYRGFVRFANKNIIRPSKFFVTLSSFDNDNEMEETLDVLEKLYNNKKLEKNVFVSIENDITGGEKVIKDFVGSLKKIEIEILFLKYKDYNVNEICEILGIGTSKYYEILSKLKKIIDTGE